MCCERHFSLAVCDLSFDCKVQPTSISRVLSSQRFLTGVIHVQAVHVDLFSDCDCLVQHSEKLLLEYLMCRFVSRMFRCSVFFLRALPHAVSATNVKDTASLFRSALRSGVKEHSASHASFSVG